MTALPITDEPVRIGGAAFSGFGPKTLERVRQVAAQQPSAYSDTRRASDVRSSSSTTADPWQWIDAPALAEPLGPVPWVVPELQLGPGRPCSVQSYGSGMKTLAVGSLAIAAAAGLPVWGCFSVNRRPRSVRWFDYEMGQRASQRRFQRLSLGLGVELAGLPFKLSALPKMCLTDDGARAAFMRGAEGVDLGVVDSFRAGARGADENDSAVREYLDLLLEVSERTGITWIVLHHVGKTKDGHDDARQKGRGASAIFDAWGAVLDFTKESDSIRKVSMTKTHPEAEGPIEPFYLEVADVAQGTDPKAGVVVRHRTIEQVHPPEQAGAELAADVSRIVDALRREGGANGLASIDAVVGAAGMRLSRGRAAFRLAEARGLIARSGTSRDAVYRVNVPPVCVRETPHTPRDVGTSSVDARETSGTSGDVEGRPDVHALGKDHA